MQATLPFYEGPEDALRAAVQALGGAKRIGAELWPDKGADQAARLLLDCLNPSRPEKLDLSQVLMILGRARAAGYHAAFDWIAHQTGYEAKPIVREEEIDRLAAVLAESTRTTVAALAALERLQRSRV